MSLLFFLLAAILISMSGVMMPGPVLASTVVEGYRDKYAGVKIAVGHAFIEFPLMFLIFFGAGYLFTSDMTKAAVGAGGGILLLFLGWKMLIYAKEDGEEKPVFRNPYILGLAVSLSSPYFFLWWATVGTSLIIKAIEIGLLAFVLFIFVHWFCDVAWLSFISFTTFKSKKFWRGRIKAAILSICGVVMISFGIYFIATAVIPV